MNRHLPDLPLLLADVPPSLCQALAQEGVPTADQRSGLAGRLVLFDSRRSRPMLVDGQIGVDVDVLRATRSRDPMAALADERAACHEWRIGELEVRETVARVNRAAVRRRMLADLRVQVEAAGGIWLRLSSYPAGYRSAFNFRLDHDDYDPHDFDATLAAIAGHEHAVSHYICAATHARYPEAVARLKDAHVGSHGWWHHTYREPADNLVNIRRGIDGLRAMGLNPVGFAAPHGRFNAGLLAALEDLGVTHSSEFGLAYDDLPFFPRQSDVLQIPVHPICLGVCLEAARRMPEHGGTDEQAAETTLNHWLAVVEQKRAVGEPIFLYGHPNGRIGRFPHQLRELLDCVSQLPDVWCVTLADFEQWWRQRANIQMTASQGGDVIEITARGLPPNHRATIELLRDNRVAQMDLACGQQTISTRTLSWNRRDKPRMIVGSPTTAGQGLRASLREYLDWERVTPVGEITAQTWRGWAKRALRRVRA